MFIIVFLLGRPGSGKSSVASLIQELADMRGWLIEYINDYELLQEMFLREEAESTSLIDRNFEQTGSEKCIGFGVKNPSVLISVLREIKLKVENVRVKCLREKVTICIIEFARANYQDSLEMFGEEILANSHVLYLNVDFDICIERNHKRTDHFVSDEIMITYYHYDDWARVMYNLQHGCDKYEIKNVGTLKNLEQKVEEWCEKRLESEVLVPDRYVKIR